MSRVVIRGLRRQLKLGALQQPIHEVVQPQEQPCFQAKGIPPIEAPNNEPQQRITVEVPFHQVPSIGQFFTP